MNFHILKYKWILNIESSEVTFKSNQRGTGVKSKDTLDIHTQETHTEKWTCKECDYTSTTVKNMNEHSKMEHKIEQLDGSTEIKQSDKRKEHDDLWCYKCEEEDPNCKGWEYQFSNRPAVKAHMHNDHGITIFEEIIINDYGGYRRFLQPEFHCRRRHVLVSYSITYVGRMRARSIKLLC